MAISLGEDPSFPLSGRISANEFKGEMDSVRIYNRALSSNEVLQLYSLEAPPLPVIASQPQSVSTNLGSAVNFSVSATGTNGVWFQWLKDGVPLPNATNNLLALTNVQPPNIGDYTAIVTGYGGSLTSSVASLSISNINSGIWKGLVAYYPFSGNANDASGFGNNGTVSNATLTADRFGNSLNAYSFAPQLQSQISFSSGILPSGTNPMTVSYWMEIENPTLPGGTFNKYPVFCVQQDSQTSWNFNLIYQPDGTTFTPNTEIFTNSVYQGGYSVWNLFSSFTSATNWHHFSLTFGTNNDCLFFLDGTPVNPTPASIANYSRPQGTWYIGGFVPYPAGTFFSGKLDDFRIYNRALSSDEIRSLYASEAVPPTVTGQPYSIVADAHTPASFSVSASGSPPLAYQWWLSGTNLPNATNATLILNDVTPANLGTYRVVITNVAGSVTSSPATLYLYPYIVSPFTGAITYWGQSATLTVVAWGSGISYQWYLDGVEVPGATGSTLFLPSIQFTNGGMYSVVVSSIFDSVTNTPAQVVVNPANVSIKLCPDVVIQGTVGYSYLIQSSTNLVNTNAWITLTNLTLTQPIQYWDDTSNDWTQAQRFYRVLPGQ